MVNHYDQEERRRISHEGGRFNFAQGVPFHTRDGLEAMFVLTPNVGTRGIGLTSGFHSPGQGFEPHKHPLSEEVLVVVRGKGQIYLKDRWLDVEEGDVVYAPPGVLHGTRNPSSNTEVFVTLGCASPPQLDLYEKANYALLTASGTAEDGSSD